jgi:ribonuclease P protein component
MGRAWGRLPQRSDFLRVAAAGLRQGTPAFLLQAAAQDPALAHLRIGFTASRKLGNAVTRNRAKRRLRAAADAALKELSGASVDLVLVARAAAVSREFAAISRELRSAAERMLRKLPAPPPAPPS